MQAYRTLLAGLISVLYLVGCSTPPKQQTKMSAGAGALIGAGAGALVGNPFIGFIAGGAIGAAKELRKAQSSDFQPSWDENYSEYDTISIDDGLDLPAEAYATWDDSNHTQSQWDAASPQAERAPNPNAESPRVDQKRPLQHDNWQAYRDAANDPFYVPRESFYR